MYAESCSVVITLGIDTDLCCELVELQVSVLEKLLSL